MDTAAIWLLRMFLKLLDLLDLNSLAGFFVKDVYECREARIYIFGGTTESTIACDSSIWLGYILWVIVIAVSYILYKRYKRRTQAN
jgi:hypothetical protein